MKTSQKLLIITIALEFILTMIGIIIIKNVVKNNIVFGSGKIITDKTIIQPFNKLSLSGNITVHWKKSDSIYVNMKIDESLRKQINIKSDKGILSIVGPEIFRKKETVITLYSPVFSVLDIDNGSVLFTDDTLNCNTIELNSNHGSEVTLKANNQFIHIVSNNGSDVRINGIANAVKAEAKNGSKINIDHLLVKTINAKAILGSTMNILVSDSLTATAISGSSIDLYGNPKYKQLHTDESGFINQQ
jgi:hypothetical protein